jgi:mannose-6-phosphate isomerase-like protein (cupin superfamily)
MSAEYQTIVLEPGQGKMVSTMGINYIFKAVTEETGGQYFCMEGEFPPDLAGPPKHIHRKMEEVFYILEGEPTLYLGDQEVKVTAGSFIQIPRGTAHTFANFGTVAAKVLLFTTPAGFEYYFEELPSLVSKYGFPLPADIMTELGRKYDTEVVGPPPRKR